jgi:hypothetical protein
MYGLAMTMSISTPTTSKNIDKISDRHIFVEILRMHCGTDSMQGQTK